jgi:hypothetical protein
VIDVAVPKCMVLSMECIKVPAAAKSRRVLFDVGYFPLTTPSDK